MVVVWRVCGDGLCVCVVECVRVWFGGCRLAVCVVWEGGFFLTFNFLFVKYFSRKSSCFVGV